MLDNPIYKALLCLCDLLSEKKHCSSMLKYYVRYLCVIIHVDPCMGTCDDGYECLFFEGEPYCSPNCVELNPCGPHERCVLTNVTCIRAPCPPVLSCEETGNI